MLIDRVTPEELKAAMPQFKFECSQKQYGKDFKKLPLALKVRCGIVDYILNGNGLSEERFSNLSRKCH